MLKLRVFSQRSMTFRDQKLYVGEDAYPFINDAGMFVADGMGGSAGIRVVRFHEDCFDADALVQRLCKRADMQNNFPPEYGEAFTQYIRDDFATLTNPAIKDLYADCDTLDNQNAMKKSGFVGSHALSVAAAFIFTDLQYRRDQANIKSQKKWQDTIQTLCLHDSVTSLYKLYLKILQALGAECAKTTLNKIDYFGTTLSAALYWEEEEEVNVCFLNTGDSRSYVWDEDGFRQAVDDQGQNGGMSCYLSTSSASRSQIAFEARTYRKPCVLLCMTDGVYGSFHGKDGFDSSPLFMEGNLLSVLANASSVEEAEAEFTKAFDVIGQHDDSNSMTIAAFGYEDYGELREAAAARTKFLDEKYQISESPEDIFEEDYAKRLAAEKRKASARIRPQLERALKLETVRRYCLDQAEQLPKYQRDIEAVSALQEKAAEDDEQQQALRRDITRLVNENYVDFVCSEAVEREVSGSCLSSKSAPDCPPRPDPQKCRDAWGAWEKCLDTLTQSGKKLKERLDALKYAPAAGGSPDIARVYGRLHLQPMSDAVQEVITRTQRDMEALSDAARRALEEEKQWAEDNKRFAEYYGRLPAPEDLAEELLQAPDATWRLSETTIPQVHAALLDAIRQYHNITAEIKQLQKQADEARTKIALQYWMEHAIDVLPENEDLFTEKTWLRQRLLRELNQNDELAKCEKEAKQQEKMFQEYLEAHLRDVSDRKRRDVDINGWL